MDQNDVYWYDPYYSAAYCDSSQDPALQRYYSAQGSYPQASTSRVDTTLPQGPQREFGRDKQQNKSYAYEVKIINPHKKSDYVVRRWHDETGIFTSPGLLKEKLRNSFPGDVSTRSDFKMGYMQGNHKSWIFEDRDLQSMYESLKSGSKILLWCDGVSDDNHAHKQPRSKRRKTSAAPAPVPIPTVSDDSSETMTEGQIIIFKRLKEKHPDMDCVKLRMWARLINRGRYGDYDKPPPIPLITGSPVPVKRKNESLSSALVDAATVVAKAFQSSHAPPTTPTSPTQHADDENLEPPPKSTPLKNAKLRRSCLEDLKSLKELYRDEVLSEAEFTEEKSKIMSTLKTLQ